MKHMLKIKEVDTLRVQLKDGTFKRKYRYHPQRLMSVKRNYRNKL